MIKSDVKYPSLLKVIWEVISRHLRRGFISWPDLGIRFITALMLTYSLLNICYVWNIDVTAVLRVPLFDFFRLHLVPALSAPLRFIGFDWNTKLEAILAISASGASIWAGAEYRRNVYLILHFFPNIQLRPGYWDPQSFLDEKNPFAKEALKTNIIRKLIRPIEVVILSYSFLGIFGLLIGFIYGIQFVLLAFVRTLAFTLSILLNALQRLTYFLEKPEDEAYWGTIVFLKILRTRTNVDDWLEGQYQAKPILTNQPFKIIFKQIAAESADVTCVALICVIAVLVYL